jgi:hypothetical protein
MALAPPHVIATSTQAWRLIEKDYTLRLSIVAPKWAEEHQKAKNMLFAEARRRGNSAYLGPAWVDMEIADTNTRAEWAYKACCEVWEIQGRPKCRAFFRGVFDWCLQPIFAVRKGCFQSQLELHQTRTGRTIPQGTAIYGHMNRQMGKLISEWDTRLEIDARDNDYQRQRIGTQELQQARTPAALVSASVPIDVPGPTGDERTQSQVETLTIEHVGTVASTFTWKDLEIRFQSIHANASGQRFSANFIRTDWESGDVSEEWIVGGNAAFREEFENLASISARKLGCTRSEGANEYWLDRVWEWMQLAGLDKDKSVAWLPTGTVVQAGHTGTTQGLHTEKIAELSAQFCLELMARGTPESAVSPLSKRTNMLPKFAPTVASTNSRPKGRLNYRSEVKRAIQAELTRNPSATNLAICRAFDSNGNAELPKNWQPNPGERAFEKAYLDSRKKTLIEKMISKVRADMREAQLLPLR